MAVTVSATGSSLTLSKYLKVFGLSLQHNSGFLYKTYRIFLLFATTFLYIAGVYFKLEECVVRIVILRYVDLFLHNIRYALNAIDLILPLFAKHNLLYLTELLDATKTSHKKTIFSQAILNYCFIIFQLLLHVASVCYGRSSCNILCMLPYFISYTLMTLGSFRCLCVLILLKRRVCEVSQDLTKKLAKIGVTDNLSVNIRQVDELLRGIHAFGRCFGIQLALQFVNLEGVVVHNVVMVKKTPAGIPLLVDLLLTQTTFVSGVCYEILMLSGCRFCF